MRTTLVSLSLLLVAACVDGPPEPTPGPGMPPAGGTDGGPVGPLLAVATSDFTSGALAVVDLDRRILDQRVDVIDPQAVVRVHGGRVYVLDQTHGVLRIYNPQAGWRPPVEIAVGSAQVPAAQTNPHDIHVEGDRAYVTLYGAFGSTLITGDRAIGILDLADPRRGLTGFVPVAVAPRDSDNNPEADRLVSCGGRLYVTLQDLDRNDRYRPAGPARLAVIDPARAQVLGYIQLAGHNPTAIAVPGGDCRQAMVAHGDDQLSAMPTGRGGIERVDLTGMRSLGLLVTDAALGGNVSTLDAAEPGVAFVSLLSRRGMEFHHEIFAVDLQAGQRSGRILGPMNYVPAVRVTHGQLLVLSAGFAGAGQLRPGLYVGRADGKPLPAQPLDLGLPPISLDVIPR
ncbi:MAG: hypothetical protein RMK29_17545 [Myxococcales bacterium]|nr:hypothetical protein [Myxococcota bacterium]MDW8283515.1 hypothetical protein [Myxococcales bacterium]